MTSPDGKLKVFISWSMPLSHDVAKILRDWLPRVIQDVEPWVSSEDIEKGTYWTEGIVQSLDAAKVGIIVVTPENHQRTWLNFEAGALARSNKASGVVTPLLIDMDTTSIQGPMTTLQITNFTQEDTTKLLTAVNGRTRTPLSTDVLTDLIDLLWPGLEKAVADLIAKHGSQQPPTLSDRAIWEGVLTGVRELRRITVGGSTNPSAPIEMMTAGPGVRIVRERLKNYNLDAKQARVYRTRKGNIAALFITEDESNPVFETLRDELKQYDVDFNVSSDVVGKTDALAQGHFHDQAFTFHIWWNPDVLRQIGRAGAEGRLATYQVCDWKTPLPADVLLARHYPGDGVIDLDSLTRAVVDTGCTGDIEVEIFNADIWAQAPDAVVRRTVESFGTAVSPFLGAGVI